MGPRDYEVRGDASLAIIWRLMPSFALLTTRTTPNGKLTGEILARYN